MMHKILLQIPTKTHLQLKIIAKEKGQTVQSTIRALVDGYVNNEEFIKCKAKEIIEHLNG